MTAPRWVLPGYAGVLSLAVLAPLLRPGGYLLLRDAVSTPRSYLTDAALGLGELAPRAVPQDVAVATLSAIVDGGTVVTALLLAALVIAGWGAGRLAGLLLPEAGLPGQLVAATVAVWNPYVAERLLQGHWSLLLGYGCLPWVAATVISLRRNADRRDWAVLVFWVAVAGLTPTGLILAAIVGLVSVMMAGAGVGRWRCAGGVCVIAVLGALPWLTASLLGTALSGPQSAGLAPFAARAEPGLGTLGSLAGLGGIWNAEAVPPTRATGFAVVGTAVLLAIVVCGASVLVRRRIGEPLLVLAAVSVLVPAALATGPGLAALRTVVDTAPGMAVLRDGQKWVALAMPGYALAGAAAVLAVQRWARPAVSAAVCCLALIAVLPDLAWGVWGRVVPVHYPPQWSTVAQTINADPRPVAVLPPGSMRRFDWAGQAPVLDPLPRWLRAEVLTTGDLNIAGTTVPGEGNRARAVEKLLLDGADRDALARAGVGWVVTEHRGSDLTAERVGGDLPPAPRSHRLTVLAAHLVWAAMIVAGGALSLRRGRAGAGSPRGCAPRAAG